MKIVDDNNRSEYKPKPDGRNDDKPQKIHFLGFYILFYAATISFFLLTGKLSVEYTKGFYNLSWLVLFPALFIFYYGAKTIQLIKSIPPKYFLCVVISIALATGYYFVFGERTYADCILNHVKSTGEYYAVQKIETACHAKYR